MSIPFHTATQLRLKKPPFYSVYYVSTHTMITLYMYQADPSLCIALVDYIEIVFCTDGIAFVPLKQTGKQVNFSKSFLERHNGYPII